MVSLSEEYIDVLKRRQEEAKDNLTLLESGSIRRGESLYGGDWVDITQREIQRAREEVDTYKNILAGRSD